MGTRWPAEQEGKGRSAVHRNALTAVELIWIEGRIEHWTRVGRIAAERIVSRKTRMVSFRPDAVFSLVRWTSNDYGTIHSRIDILRAVMPGEGYTTAPFVQPGGELYPRSEEHTSELQSLMRYSYTV